MDAKTELRDRVNQLRKDAKGFQGSKGITQDQADNLDRIRELLGWTRKEFASRINLPVSTYEKWLESPDQFGKLYFRWFYFKVWKQKPSTDQAA